MSSRPPEISGKVFRQAGKAPAEAAWTVVLDAADTQALCLAATSEGKVFVGTGPSGQVIEVTDPGHPASKPDPKVQYIWDLTADAEGSLYAATGPNGQLWKRARDGKWSLLLDSKAAHLLSVAVAADGTVYAGSDGEGLIYRVSRQGKTSVLYDAPQSDIRTLLVAPDGSLYAGTAAEAGGGASPGRGPSLFSGGSQESDQVALDRDQIRRRPAFAERARAGLESSRCRRASHRRAPGRLPLGLPRPDRPRPSRFRRATTRSTSSSPTAPFVRSFAPRHSSSPSPGRRIDCSSAPARKASSTRSATGGPRARRWRSWTMARFFRSWPNPAARSSWARAIRARWRSSHPGLCTKESWSPRCTTPSSSADSGR